MKVAIIHDWLVAHRGGEKVLEVLCRIFSQADIYTLIVDNNKISPVLKGRIKKTSFLQAFPFSHRKYQAFLPLFPLAISNLKLKDEYDLIISSSHCVAKGINKTDGSIHICYCYTPMRYIWVFFDTYFPPRRFFLRTIMNFFRPYLKRWDLKKNQSIDYFVAISNNIKKRIKDYYKRDAEVIYPPVDTDFFHSTQEKKDFYLIVSALVPYKRIDLAIEAFNRLKKSLYIVGEGICKKELMNKAKDNIKFLGWVNNYYLRELYSSARALIFPGEEDFGLVPLEAQSCQTPVICFRRGGALETVVDIREDGSKASGLFFEYQEPEALIEAVLYFEKIQSQFDPALIRKNSLRFSTNQFESKFKKFVDRVLYGEDKKN